MILIVNTRLHAELENISKDFLQSSFVYMSNITITSARNPGFVTKENIIASCNSALKVFETKALFQGAVTRGNFSCNLQKSHHFNF